MYPLWKIRTIQKLAAGRDCSRCALTFKNRTKWTLSYIRKPQFSTQFSESYPVQPILVGDKPTEIHLD